MYALTDGWLGDSAHAKPKAQILGYRHVGVKGIALENHSDIPVPRGETVNGLTIQ